MPAAVAVRLALVDHCQGDQTGVAHLPSAATASTKPALGAIVMGAPGLPVVMRLRTRPAMKLAGLATAGFLALACSGTATTSPSTTGHPAGTPSPLANAVPVSGGCGSTQLYTGGMPAWLHNGIHGLTEMDDVPYAVARPTPVAGFIMSYPLKAGPDVPKILWVVGTPRNGGALSIQAHPAGSSGPVVNVSRPANAGPGEIYPDGVPIPTAGCWHFSLQWATGHAELDLLYSS